MSDKRFYCEEIKEGVCTVSGAEAHHLAHVMRLGVGDSAELFDGAGKVGQGTVSRTGGVRVEVEVEKVTLHGKRQGGRIIIAASIAKGQVFEQIIKQCTELGADHIAAVIFERTVKQPKGKNLRERFHKIAVAACKQCGRVFLPCLSGPSGLEETIVMLRGAYPQAGIFYGGLKPGLQNIEVKADADVAVFVGPEGGLCESEETILFRAGAQGVRISENILRTETAAAAFTALLCRQRSMTI